MFTIKEIFATLQGEGSRSGTPAIFVRFAGCNLWSGQDHLREKGKGHCALWCDTDFFRGDKYEGSELLNRLNRLTSKWQDKMVVFTGGEPCLQLKKPEAVGLIERLLNTGWVVAIETNGTISAEECQVLNILNDHPNGHITVSPKPLMDKSKRHSIEHIKLRFGTDLKIIIPTVLPLNEFQELNFEHFFFQPMDLQDGTSGLSSVEETIEFCITYGWRLSCQTHKFLNLQ